LKGEGFVEALPGREADDEGQGSQVIEEAELPKARKNPASPK